MVAGLQGPSPVRCLAGYLRFLNSAAVRGADGNEPPRRSFVKEMFGDTKVHGVTVKSVSRKLESGDTEEGTSMRSSAWSTIFWDKLAELQVLAFFCANGYEVEFPAGNSGSKKPEFFIQVRQTALGVEVKNLDVDAVLDRIYGDFDSTIAFMHNAGPESETSFVGPGDYHGIVGMIERQYGKAVQKFSDAPGLVFIFVPLDRGQLGRYLDEYIAALFSEWNNGDDCGVVGLVLAFNDSVQLQRHPDHQTLTEALRLEQVDLAELREVYELCTERDLWPPHQSKA